MHVAIAVVGFRNAHDIVECLKALEGSTHTDFEVIICENGGPEAFAALSAVLPGALPGGQPVRAVMASSNLGFAGGVNVGLNETPHADAWWVLNPDTQPEPGALAAKVARLARGDCDAIGCTLYRPDGSIQSHGGHWWPWMARAESLGIGRRLGDPVDAAWVERTQNYLNGAAMLISRRFLERAGPMREEYFLYCEEVEWCLRALELGLKLGFAPDARVLHAQGTTTGAADDVAQRPRMPIYLSQRNAMLVTRDRFPARLPVAALALMSQLALRCVRHRAWRQFGYGASGIIAGLLNRRGAA